MNKVLNMNANNCLLSIDCINGVKVNEKDLNEIIYNNLPKLKEYKNYPVKLNLQIEFLGDDEFKINTEGYEIKTEGEGEKLC